MLRTGEVVIEPPEYAPRAKMQVKPAYLIGGGLIIVFGVVALVSFGQAMVPYVKMSQARLGDYCQVTATVVHSTRHFDSVAQTNIFYIESDKGDRLKVSYHRPLPANFDKVKQVSVKGQYKNAVFEADEVLTK